MKEYYNKFVELSMQQCTKNDYADKNKVKVHNEASKKLLQLQEEMKKIDYLEILQDLLNHDDDRVKINAASFCFRMNVYREKVVNVLKSIINTSNDNTIRFSAEMILENLIRSENE